GKVFADELRLAQSRKPCGCEDDCVVLTFLKLAYPRIDIAAEGMDVEVRAKRFQLCLSPQAAGADTRTLWKTVDTIVMHRQEHVVWVYTFCDGDQFKTWREFRRQILQAMHRKIDAALGEGFFDFLGEHSLGSDLRKCDIGDLVAGCLDDLEFDLVPA